MSDAPVVFRISPALQAMVGASMDDYDDFLSCLMPESAHLLESKWQAFLERPDGDERFLAGFKVGEKVSWLINKLHLAECDGVPVLYSTCVEVSEMYELEEQLIESHSRLMVAQLRAQEEAAKKEAALLQQQFDEQTQFLAMLSHELRSPLMGMNSLISVVKKKQWAQQDTSDELKTMRLTIEHLNFLINDILTFAQAEFGPLELNPTVFELDQLGEYVRHLTRSIASEKGLFVAFAISSQNNCFYGDLVRVSQILVNLIVNAIKFTEIGGVFVEVQEQDSALKIQVTDSGAGMNEEDLHTIFKPFKQLGSDVGQRHLGSGLGLSIVKTLIDLMGGTIHVESTKGIGSSFCVELPMEAKSCPVDMTDRLPAPMETNRFNPTRFNPTLGDHFQCHFDVLIADDSKINQMVLETFLEQLGCRVERANDGNQAWQKFQQKPYQFVFLDIQMPGLTGAEVCQKIRDLPQEAKPALKGVFALTAAHTVYEIEQMGIEIDQSIFDEWVEKPISEDKIIHLLHCKECGDPNWRLLEATGTQSHQFIPEHLVHLWPQFEASVRADIKALRAYQTSASGQDALDLSEVRKLLHRMKGNFMLFNLTDWVESIREMENVTADGLPSLLQTRLNQMEHFLKEAP
ncbi:MAG: hybrid sensor histidine kinase/response regulator [Hydrogenovibrio sp.]